MKRILALTGAVILGALSPHCANASGSGSVLFTNETDFLGGLDSGYYLEDFDSLKGSINLYKSSWASSGGSPLFSYTIAAAHGLYVVNPSGSNPVNPALAAYNVNDSLLVTFTSGNVSAVGGDFMLTDLSGRLRSGTVTATLSDGTLLNSASGDFTGFASLDGQVITSLTISSPIHDAYHIPTLDHLYAAVAVPEPATMALLLLPLGASALRMLRRWRSR